VVKVILPTFHADQVRAYRMKSRFKAVRCGRRWGKTILGETVACDGAIKKQSIGWFAPAYKYTAEVYNDIDEILRPVKLRSSKTEGVYRTRSGGHIDFWTLENQDAGRGRKYHGVVIDEGAFAGKDMMSTWQRAIRPTLLDFGGWALVLSNTNGEDPENFFWRICNEPEHGFREYHAPTHNNPHLPAEEVEKLIRENHPLVYRQEYLAEFVDWAGVAFFSRASLLVNDQPLPLPMKCDAIYAIIDSATKTGKDNDGTAVTFFALNKHDLYPLQIVDWDIVQIEGAVLETWLPTVFQRLEELAKACGARMGSLGVWIEDAASGMILLQQARRRNWPARPIDSKLTSVGKDERAISVSGYVYQGKVKFTAPAYEKTVNFKNVSRNHLLSQIVGFRVGDKEAAKRPDDLLDTFTYGVAIGLGNAAGF